MSCSLNSDALSAAISVKRCTAALSTAGTVPLTLRKGDQNFISIPRAILLKTRKTIRYVTIIMKNVSDASLIRETPRAGNLWFRTETGFTSNFTKVVLSHETSIVKFLSNRECIRHQWRWTKGVIDTKLTSLTQN